MQFKVLKAAKAQQTYKKMYCWFFSLIGIFFVYFVCNRTKTIFRLRKFVFLQLNTFFKFFDTRPRFILDFFVLFSNLCWNIFYLGINLFKFEFRRIKYKVEAQKKVYTFKWISAYYIKFHKNLLLDVYFIYIHLTG